MDSFGFVFLNVIANFNRIRQLTQDIELLRYSCYQSRAVEFLQGSDGLDRVRRREGWRQWVLGPDERDASVRHDVPVFPPSMLSDMAPAADGRQLESNRQSVVSVETPQYMEQSAEDSLYPITNGEGAPLVPTMYTPLSNGMSNGDAGTGQTSLSSSITEVGSGPPFPSSQDDGPQGESTVPDAFSDKQVDNLMMVIRDPTNVKTDGPTHPAVIRTFSNGSIDEQTIAEVFGKGLSKDEPQGGRIESS